ncbi:unnamed protein product, partial [Callosobruchus maculatus]
MRTPNKVITQVSKDHVIITKSVEPSDEEWKGGLGCFWFNLLQRNKGKTFIINGDTEEYETRGSFLSKSIRVALILQKHGIQKGDIVTFALNIHQNAYAALVGSLFIGAIPNFIEPYQNSDEAAQLLRAVEPKLVVSTKDGGKFDVLSKAKKSIKSDVKLVTLEDCEEFYQPQEAEANFVPVPVQDNEETALICFSSGSTGLPKGICLPHLSFLPTNWLRGSENVENPVIMTFDSLYWTTDIYRFIFALREDATLLITPTFDPQKIWKRIERYKVNKIECCPHQAILLATAGKPKGLDTSSLIKLIVMGGVFPERYLEDLQKMIPTTLIIPNYGCTEVGPMTTFLYDWPDRPGSIIFETKKNYSRMKPIRKRG